MTYCAALGGLTESGNIERRNSMALLVLCHKLSVAAGAATWRQQMDAAALRCAIPAKARM